MATSSRLFSRVTRRIAAASRPIAADAHGGIPVPRIPPVPFPGACRPVQTEVAHYQATRYCHRSFVVNPALQRFGYSSAASQPATVASQKPLLQGSTQKLAADSPKEASKIPATSYTGISKFPPYYLLFGWIEEIILDYVHHEVTRSMVLVYLRVFLLIVLKDVFLNIYDLFA